VRRIAITIAMLGCNAREQPLDAEETSTSGASSSTSSTTALPWPPPTSDGGDTISIIDEPDLGGRGCDLWGQDCPPGEKCMPYATDDSWYDATRCTPIADDPKRPGEPCTVIDSPVSGIDDCETGAMCWGVDAETNTGQCAEMCKGSEANPYCDAPCATCFQSGSSIVSVCLESCDPLAPACGDGLACYPIVDAFVCGPDMSDRAGVAGDTCEFINVCDPGLLCANPELVPGCTGPSCCTPFCNVDEPDDCDAQLPGSTCVPWFDTGRYSETCFPTGTIGYCGVPP
jgi:hypothetical protein